jgi:hypothetical protein
MYRKQRFYVYKKTKPSSKAGTRIIFIKKLGTKEIRV